MLMSATAAVLERPPVTEPVNWLRWGMTLSLFVVTVSSLAGFVYWLTDPGHSPLRRVDIKGDFRYLDKAQLQSTLAPMLENGFFKIDVAGVQQQAEALPWVKRASVRRIWPDRLQIHIVEQQPFTFWDDQSLLNPQGEVFTPARQPVDMTLPRLSGPPGHAIPVLANYQHMNDMVKGLGLTIDELHQDNRRAWRLTLSNGMTVEMGRTDPVQRLARFIAVYPSILATTVNAVIEQVDLRYSNGFAVRWSQLASEEETG